MLRSVGSDKGEVFYRASKISPSVYQHQRNYQDGVINDDDIVGRAEDCVDICEVHKIGVEGKDLSDLMSNSVRKAIADLEGCVRSVGLVCQ